MKVTLINSMGSDNTVVDAARVSFAKTAAGYSPEQNSGLIQYLARHNHWTPFGHCQATFHIEAPLFVARQLAKHQVGLVWNEESRRYIDEPPRFYNPSSWRPRAADKKQGSVRGDQISDMPRAWMTYELEVRRSAETYRELLDLGVAPEQARMILPQSMMTEWYWTGSLAAWARVCRLRMSNDAQHETEFVARQISAEMGRLFPVSWKAMETDDA